jgi:hypothetical protein
LFMARRNCFCIMLQYEPSEREQMSEHNAGAVTVVTLHVKHL